MYAFAGNFSTIHLDTATAGKPHILGIRKFFQRRRQGDNLKNRTGRIHTLGKAVHIDTFIPAAFVIFYIRNIIRVIIGSGNRTKDGTGPVVINRNGSFLALQSLQRSHLHLGRQGKLCRSAGVTIGIDTIQQVIACQFCRMGWKCRSIDTAIAVTQPVNCGFPKGR